MPALSLRRHHEHATRAAGRRAARLIALVTLLALALVAWPAAAPRAMASSISLYANSFEFPNHPVERHCGNSLDTRGIDYLYGKPGFTYQQVNSVEVVIIHDPLRMYSSPQGIGGQYAIGMLSTLQDDKLGLTFNGQKLSYVNVSFDLSAIDVQYCGGPFGVSTPVMRVSLLDSPGGVFNFNNRVLDSADLTGNAPPNQWTFNWTTVSASLNASGSTDGWISVVFDLLQGGYAAFDNLSITSSSQAGVTDGDLDAVPDDADLCPGTPAGQPVDANGCSASQDTTAPVISIGTSAVLDASTGWYNLSSSGTGGVLVNVGAADASKVAALSCTDNGTPVTIASLSGLGANNAAGTVALADGIHGLSCTATDGAAHAHSGAGPGSTAMPVAFNVDQTGPMIAASVSPAAAPTGWWNINTGAPTLTFSCRDAVSDIATCPASHTFQEGSGLTWSGTAQDRAGNSATATFGPVNIDMAPPSIMFTAQPPPLGNSTTASFSFASSEANCTFQCSLDGGAFAACTSPASYNNLADGVHTFSAQAIDQAGNIEANATSVAWTIDTVTPQAAFSAGPASLTNQTGASFSFAGSEPGTTFMCGLDSAVLAPCTSPQTVSGLTDGGHTFLVQATDPAGNVEPSPARYDWTIDTAGPDTLIKDEPAALTNSTAAGFSFESTEAGSTFRCSLDDAAFAACTNPAAYTSLADGSHTFLVQATDPAGNVDTTPASYTWTIDTRAGQTSIDTTPPILTNDRNASFTFHTTKTGSSYECSLDDAPFAACSSPASYSDLADGSHTFATRSIDTLGNVEPSPPSFTWMVDTTPPSTSLDAQPCTLSNGSSASFSFTSNETGGSFQCKLDDAEFAPCISPAGYNTLADGAHTFIVKAIDQAGNVETNPPAATWTIDTVEPVTSITAEPANPINSTGATFQFVSNEAGSTFQCGLDGAPLTPCSSPLSLSGLAAGSHTFVVKATDAANNTDANGASYGWTIDLTAPVTTITGGPSNPAKINTASFTFSSSEDPSTFRCSLDGAAFADCVSPQAYGSLADGSHTFAVAATDAAGNPDPNSASFAWTVDTIPPETTIESGPAAHTDSTTATFEFASSESGGSFECSLDGAPFAACTSPAGYNGLSDGSHAFHARAIDLAGNVDQSPAGFAWAVDTTAPVTTIGSKPSNPTNLSRASFEFASSKPGSTFQCSLDGGALAACTSPQAYDGLQDGSHVFTVQATDPFGNLEPNAPSYTWTIDTVPPATTVTGQPPALTNIASASFSFSSEANSAFQCKLDEGDFGVCTSPASYNNLADGSHTFTVKATDPAGNLEANPPGVTWVIDTVPPVTSLSASVGNLTNSTTASFTFGSSESSNSTFVCSLDGAALTACTSPKSYGGLAKGSHTFLVKASDAAGNVDPNGAHHNWTVDLIAPDTIITARPANPTYATAATFGFASSEPSGSTFACSLDNAAFAVCTSPRRYSGLAAGRHTFRVKATDAAGNSDPTPATVTWTIKPPFNFCRFFSPVANRPAWYPDDAGRLIPIKFSLCGRLEREVFASGYPKFAYGRCGAPPINVVSASPTGNSSLNYDPATDEYNYVWKTDKSWAGLCGTLDVMLANGTSYKVDFQFK